MGISAGISTGKNKYIKGVGIPSKGRTNFGVRFSDDETDERDVARASPTPAPQHQH